MIQRLLIVDESPFVRAALHDMLNHLSYEVESSCNKNEALELFKGCKGERKFDAVIIEFEDMHDNVTNNILSEIRNIDQNIKTIALGTKFCSKFLSNFTDYGFNAVLVKPFKLDELLFTLKFIEEPSQLQNS
ncbi:MAG TPA: response regulator [Desulfomonilia bacterium]|nr:response regulator [Desulfomonilia bacterium]